MSVIRCAKAFRRQEVHRGAAVFFRKGEIGFESSGIFRRNRPRPARPEPISRDSPPFVARPRFFRLESCRRCVCVRRRARKPRG